MLALGVARLGQAPALAGVEEARRRQGLAVEGARGALGHGPEGQEAEVVALRGRRLGRGEGRAGAEHAAGGGGDAGRAKSEETLRSAPRLASP